MDAATLEFIHAHANDDVRQLALRRVPDGVNLREALTQIEGRQLAACKLPACAATGGFLFPPRLSLEQCSSEATASYKRRIAERLLQSQHLDDGGGDATSFADLTGGLGIDFMAIAPLFKSATYVERNPELCELARHNLPLMGCPHAEVVCQELEAESASFFTRCYTLLYIDPARRDAAGRKVARIEDCTPDVCSLQKLLRAAAAFTLIKLSPMLDLAAALRSLSGIIEAHVVSVDGECKELLLLMMGDTTEVAIPTSDDCPIHCVDLKGTPSAMSSSDVLFTRTSEAASPFILADSIGTYLYEPNASIMKLGCYSTVEQAYELPMLSSNSHLLISNHKINDFPGREFRILEIIPFKSKEIKLLKKRYPQANVATRNFRISADALKKRLGVQDGGITYLFATTLSSGEQVLFICEKP